MAVNVKHCSSLEVGGVRRTPASLGASPITFVLPRGASGISGGHLYNRYLVGALETLLRVRVSSSGELEALIKSGQPGLYCTDSLDLERAQAIDERAPGQVFLLLAHHLPSLEPDFVPGAERSDLERSLLSRFDYVLATSDWSAEQLRRRGCAPERVLTVPPPALPGAGAKRRYEPPLRALLVGNLIRRKGIVELLTAIEQRWLPKDELQLDIVGGFDLEPRYANQCRDLVAGSPRLQRVVRFLGAVPHDQMGRHYRNASLFISASTMETFGMALAEGRVSGLPLLVLDRGAVRIHIDHGQNGYLFPTVDELAESVFHFSRQPELMRALFDRAQLGINPVGSDGDRQAPASTASYHSAWRQTALHFLGSLARAGYGERFADPRSDSANDHVTSTVPTPASGAPQA